MSRIASLAVTVPDVACRQRPVANALKNMLIGAASLVSASIFALTGPVDWTATACLAFGMLVGSNLGPRVARRLPARILRLLIAMLGIGLAIQLALNGG